MRINNTELRQLSPLTEGGEGIIYDYKGNILKIYKSCVDIKSKEKKVSMLIQKTLPKEVVKPTEPVYDNKGKFLGYIMPKVCGEEIRVLTNRKYLTANNMGMKEILEILVKIKKTVEAIHKVGICIGDLNDQNILFDSMGNVYFIDCDSWSIGTEKCEVVMDLFKDPLMKGNNFTEGTDVYAESILIWKTLTRIHPHGGTVDPDMDILERMKNGITVIDNPKVKIPRTIRPWNNISPGLVSALKNVFENKQRVLGTELEDMCKNLKYCDKDHEYYYGKFNKCPMCDGSASVITKPVSMGIASGLTLVAMLRGDDIRIVLNERCYIDNNGSLVDTKNNGHMTYEKGKRYYFLDGVLHGNSLVVLTDADDFVFTTDRQYKMPKKHKTPIYVYENDIYYISPANTFTRMTVTANGNGVRAIAKCSYETYFAVQDGHFCLVNRYDGKLIANCDGKNIEIPYNDTVINYGIQRDNISGGWLIVLENGSGTFKTYVIGDKAEYETDQIKYTCGLGNLCLSNNTIYIPIDGKIRGYSYQKQSFKDFECSIVTPDSRLIKNGAAFTIVNDENIYRLGR